MEKKPILVTALKTTGNLYCTTGRKNEYRRAFLQGLGASPKESTFDPKLGKRGGHSCCGSKVWWRHKVLCPGVTKDIS